MAEELIGREALERIIRRAAELQAGERDIGEGLKRDEVLALGKEVGIPVRYLEQALVEEQTRGPVDPGWLARLAGPAALRAARIVTGDPGAVERALSERLEKDELLRVKRRFPDHTTWEPRAGAFASLQRALGAGGRRFALARAAEVAAGITALEPGACHVQLVADVRNVRRQRVGAGGAVFAAGGLVAAVLPALGVLEPWPLLPLAAAVVAAAATRRTYLAECERIHVGLEQVLDDLEHGERPRSLGTPARGGALGRIAEELRRTLGAAP
ncbi:MAG TPA: hypothetical protein VN848_11590 [Gemmatimonadales bacterium]|nr:hypothetical protein [Gemmatimonadales bacterium]